MGIHARLLLVLLVLIACLSAAVVMLWRSADDASLDLLKIQTREMAKHMDQIVNLEGAETEKGLFNDSMWDDMVSFVRQPDRQWAEENIDGAWPNFGVDFAWVYSKALKLVYEMPGEAGNRELARLEPAVLREALHGGSFRHFYAQAPDGTVLEYWTAPVQPSADNQRVTPPRGFVVAARRLDQGFLDRLRSITGYTVTLEPLPPGGRPADAADEVSGALDVYKPIADLKGAPVALIHVHHRIGGPEWLGTPIHSFHALFRGFAAANLILLGLVIVMLAVVTVVWVKVPLKRIARSLQMQALDPVARYLRAPHEFGTVARLMRGAFAQREELLGEIARLKEYERAAQAANRAKDDFLAVLSHELRTPLNVILGFTDLARTELTDAEQTLAAIDAIENAGLQLLELIESTLEITCIRSGLGQPRLEIVSLPNLWQDMQIACSLLPRKADVAVRWSDPAPALELRTDPRMLRLIVRNLVSNAVKFTERGAVDIDLEVDGGAIVLRVSDRGIGIAAEDRQRIFELFEQLDGSSTRRHGGAGIGLYIVKQFADRLGIVIAVGERPGGGSVFTLHLPSDAGEAEKYGAPVARAEATREPIDGPAARLVLAAVPQLSQ